MGGPAAHGHGQGQFEGHGPMQSFGAATMAGGGYMPPHLRNRDRVSPWHNMFDASHVQITPQPHPGVRIHASRCFAGRGEDSCRQTGLLGTFDLL